MNSKARKSNWSNCYLLCIEDVPWIKIFKRNTLENISFLWVVAVSITLYLTVKGEGHPPPPCMTECKQTVVACRSPLLLCFCELLWSWISKLVNPEWLASDWQAINPSVKFKTPTYTMIFNSKLCQSLGVHLNSALLLVWELVLCFSLQIYSWFHEADFAKLGRKATIWLELWTGGGTHIYWPSPILGLYL